MGFEVDIYFLTHTFISGPFWILILIQLQLFAHIAKSTRHAPCDQQHFPAVPVCVEGKWKHPRLRKIQYGRPGSLKFLKASFLRSIEILKSSSGSLCESKITSYILLAFFFRCPDSVLWSLLGTDHMETFGISRWGALGHSFTGMGASRKCSKHRIWFGLTPGSKMEFHKASGWFICNTGLHYKSNVCQEDEKM